MSTNYKMIAIRLSGLIAIWVVYITNALVYAFLSIYHKVDVLFPFKIFIIVGFAFTIVYSLSGLISREQNRHLIALVLDIILLGASALGSILAIPSILSMQSEIELNFDVSVSIGCMMGIIIGLIGLSLITYYAIKSE